MHSDIYKFSNIVTTYLKRLAFHPDTCCGLLIAQDYAQMFWFLIHQSCMELVVVRIWMWIEE